jgi:protein-disulfide isomerase-like protein with CxxC motif
MTHPAEAAKNSVEIGKRHVVEQQSRIARQRDLMERLGCDGHPHLMADAGRVLDQMEQMLTEMQEHLAAAQERLAQAATDEPSLAKVEQDTPL